MVSKVLVRIGAFLVITWCAAASADAQYFLGNREAHFTFTQAFALPDTTLPAGKYLFRLADTTASRNIVQVFSDDRAILYGTYMTIPADRSTATEEAEIRLVRTTPNEPLTVESWWQPGVEHGLEFLYEKDQAQMAGANRATTGALPIEAASPEAVDAQTAPAGQAPASAQSRDGGVSAEQPDAGSPAVSARKELPQTATVIPLIALIGLLSISAGVAVRFWRRAAK